MRVCFGGLPCKLVAEADLHACTMRAEHALIEVPNVAWDGRRGRKSALTRGLLTEFTGLHARFGP